jgi:hypothetical protein
MRSSGFSASRSAPAAASFGFGDPAPGGTSPASVAASRSPLFPLPKPSDDVDAPVIDEITLKTITARGNISFSGDGKLYFERPPDEEEPELMIDVELLAHAGRIMTEDFGPLVPLAVILKAAKKVIGTGLVWKYEGPLSNPRLRTTLPLTGLLDPIRGLFGW